MRKLNAGGPGTQRTRQLDKGAVKGLIDAALKPKNTGIKKDRMETDEEIIQTFKPIKKKGNSVEEFVRIYSSHENVYNRFVYEVATELPLIQLPPFDYINKTEDGKNILKDLLLNDKRLRHMSYKITNSQTAKVNMQISPSTSSVVKKQQSVRQPSTRKQSAKTLDSDKRKALEMTKLLLANPVFLQDFINVMNDQSQIIRFLQKRRDFSQDFMNDVLMHIIQTHPLTANDTNREEKLKHLCQHVAVRQIVHILQSIKNIEKKIHKQAQKHISEEVKALQISSPKSLMQSSPGAATQESGAIESLINYFRVNLEAYDEFKEFVPSNIVVFSENDLRSLLMDYKYRQAAEIVRDTHEKAKNIISTLDIDDIIANMGNVSLNMDDLDSMFSSIRLGGKKSRKNNRK